LSWLVLWYIYLFVYLYFYCGAHRLRLPFSYRAGFVVFSSFLFLAYPTFLAAAIAWSESDSLQIGRTRNRIPVGGRFFLPVQICPVTHPGGKTSMAFCRPPIAF
jgi:hypothetical protein